MIYLKNGHSITIGNAGALASRTHVSYADVSGATLDGSSAIVTSSATTYNVATYAAAGTRNVRLVTVSNDGASAGVFTISHNTGATTAPIGKALLQPGQVLVYSENGGVQVSSAESSTLATLTLPDTPSPTVPSDGYGTIFIKKIGGRMMAAQIGPSGLDTTLQANLGGNKVALWMPPRRLDHSAGCLRYGCVDGHRHGNRARDRHHQPTDAHDPSGVCVRRHCGCTCRWA